MHAKVFSIQIFQYFHQIPPRVCTLVLFIYIIIIAALEVLQRHYQLLSKMSVDSVFDADWKEEVEDNVNGAAACQRKLQMPF